MLDVCSKAKLKIYLSIYAFIRSCGPCYVVYSGFPYNKCRYWSAYEDFRCIHSVLLSNENSSCIHWEWFENEDFARIGFLLL